MSFGLSAATIAGLAVAGVGAGTAISGAVSGGSGSGSGGSSPNVYVPPAGDLANQNSNFNNLNSYLTGSNPWNNGGQSQYANITNQMVNSPYAAQYLQAAQNAQPLAQWMGTTAQNGGQNLTGIASSGMQNALNSQGAAQNNPYMAQANAGAAQAGQMYQNAAGQQMGNASQILPYAQNINSQLQGLSNPLTAGSNAILNTAFDPQSQLYNQSYQQNQDATNASLARAGLGDSGVGVGISNTSNQNFNTNWQNQQLGREATGLASAGAANTQSGNLLNSSLTNLVGANTSTQAIQDQALGNYYTGTQLANQTYNNNLGAQQSLLSGAGNLATQAGQQYSAGNSLAGTGLQDYLTAASLPYNTSNSIYSNQLSALGGYQSAYNSGTGPIQSSIGNSLQYMGYGSNAGQGYANAAQGSWAQGNQANQQMYQGLAGLGNSFGSGGSLSGLFGSGGGGSGSGVIGGPSGSILSNGYNTGYGGG